MPWLPYTGQGGLVGWGSPPDLRATPASDLIRSIWAMREKQREQVADIPQTLAQAIAEVQRNRISDALTSQYEKEGIIPQGFGGRGGLTGLGAANQYMQAQKYRTYPTDVRVIPGEDPVTMNLTTDQRLKVMLDQARTYRGQQGYNNYIQELIDAGHLYYNDQGQLVDRSGNVYGYGARGAPRLMPGQLQPSVVQRQQAAAATRAIPNVDYYTRNEWVFDPAHMKQRRVGPSDLDLEHAWEGPNGVMNVPVINPGYKPDEPATDENPYPGQYYIQKKNPKYKQGGTESETLTRTIPIPANVYRKFFGMGPNLPAGTSAPPASSSLGGMTDEEMLAWANDPANADDPRSGAIKRALGVEE